MKKKRINKDSILHIRIAGDLLNMAREKAVKKGYTLTLYVTDLLKKDLLKPPADGRD